MPRQGWAELVLVGRIARPQGIRGEVIIDPATDFPEERFAEGGTVFVERDGAASPMIIAAFRMHAGRPVVRFEAIETMDQAETLRGLEMRVPESALGELPENVWYHHQLLGSRVRTKDGRDVGTVVGIQGPTERSILVIDGPGGHALVPLVAAFCTVDTVAKVVEIDPPEGLLEVNRREKWRGRDSESEGAERGAGAPRATEPGGVQGTPPRNDDEG